MNQSPLNPDGIEAAAKAIFDVRDDEFDMDEWEDLDSAEKERYVCDARAAVSAYLAALPARFTKQQLMEAAKANFCNGDELEREIFGIGAEWATQHLTTAHFLAAAWPRTVETVEEREALPVGTIFKDSRGLAAVKSVTGYLIAGYSGEFRALNLPATVLWTPTEGGGDAT